MDKYITEKKKKEKNTTLSEQFQIPIEKLLKKKGKIDTITHQYTTSHFPGLVQALQ
jgi:hypothetical protein